MIHQQQTGIILKKIVPKLFLTLACLMPAMACAQTTEDEFFADCPAFSEPELTTLHWEAIRAPDMLFCRAVRNDGSEAFALTFSRESPFEPRRSNREEVSQLNGREVRWYRSSIVTDRDALVREALLDFGDRHVLHISMRADDTQTLERQQRNVLALPFPRQQQFIGGD